MYVETFQDFCAPILTDLSRNFPSRARCQSKPYNFDDLDPALTNVCTVPLQRPLTKWTKELVTQTSASNVLNGKFIVTSVLVTRQGHLRLSKYKYKVKQNKDTCIACSSFVLMYMCVKVASI